MTPIIALLALTFSIPGRAENAPPKIQVTASPCGSTSPVFMSYATAVKVKSGRSFLVAGSPDIPQTDQVCAKLGASSLKLVTNDFAFGLAAYELPSGWNAQVFSLHSPVPSFFDGALTPMETTVSRIQFSSRNYLPLVGNVKYPYAEIMPAAGKNQEFFHAVGAAVGSSTDIAGILSDQTVITLPGQPAKVFRERDLSRLSITPFIYYRIAFSPTTVEAWLENAIAGAKPELELLSPTKNSKTLWKLHSHKILESCFAAGEANSGDNVPVGGIKPEGVGGLEDVLSNCRFDVEPGVDQIPGLTKYLPAGETSRMYLAYQRDATGYLKLQSIQNVHHLLQIMSQGNWSFLVEQDFLKSSSDPALRLLREKAIAAREAAVKFYQKEFGDPMILRRAFVLSTLANSSDYATVTASELEKLGSDISTDLPDHLRELDIRNNGSSSEFLREKKELLAKFKDLRDARSRLP